jgi:hypothetical protein
MFYKGYSFYRTKLSRFLCIFPSRPPTLLVGSHLSPAKSLTYWHRPHTSRTRLPVLFIHGIGIGLYPYATFLADLASGEAGSDTGPTDDGQVGVIAIEIMAISARITAQALSSDEMCEDIHRILKKHGWEKFVLVSHSYVGPIRISCSPTHSTLLTCLTLDMEALLLLISFVSHELRVTSVLSCS